MKQVTILGAMGLALVAGCNMSHKTSADSSAEVQHHHAAAAEAGAKTPDMKNPMMKAIAVLHATKGNEAHGTVRFTQEGEDSVKVVADLEGLAPNSTHGFHIHEFGDCSAPDAASAGGHWNPDGHQHGGPGGGHHAGDMGNVQANEQGNVHVELTLTHVTVGSHPNPILGRSVILHAKADDLKSQPSGESGARIACGVIGAAK